MPKPPGKLLPLVAALFCGAVVAQAAAPSDHSVTSAAPVVQPTSHGPQNTPLNHQPAPPDPNPIKHQPTPPGQKKHRSRPQRSSAATADDWNLTAHGKVLYLTFDDGPQLRWTPKVLQILRKHHAHATFFVLGREAAAHPELVARERTSGHRVGNHTWDHPMLTKLPAAKMRQEIVSGVASKCFRPPFRDTNAKVAATAAAIHQRQVLWDVDTEDWSKPGVAKIEHAILAGARPGAIILMHDGGGDRSQTVAALDRALTKLDRVGYVYRSLPC